MSKVAGSIHLEAKPMTRISQRFATYLIAAAAAVAIAACGGDDDGGGAIDANVPSVDASAGSDAPVNIDAGPQADASNIDAAGNIDAAANIDAGPAADASNIDAGPDAAPPDAGGPAAEVMINEAVFDRPGDDTAEYIEIKGMPNTDYSAYTIVQLDGDEGGEPGQIVSSHPVGTTNASGYWDTGNMNNQLQNGTQTLLLVKDYTGTNGTDLDTNDDGNLDATPWSVIVDGFAMRDGGGLTPGGAADIHYSGAAFLNKLDSSQLGGASRIPDGQDTHTAADWTFNAFDGVADGPTEANNTRGAANTVGSL